MKYKIPKSKYENINQYKFRIEFIKKMKPKKSDLEKTIILSFIASNIVFLKCRYPIEIEKKLNKKINIKN